MNFFGLLGFSIQFMTALPIKKSFQVSEKSYASIVCFFPVTSLIVGGISAACFFVLSYLGFPLIAALGCVLAECLVTGGLHMDGAADLCDAFGAKKSKERTLEILKDSRMGTFGVLALVFMVLGKILLIFSLNTVLGINTWIIVLLAPVAGKIPMAICARIGTYPREYGTGKHLIDRIQTWQALLCCAACAIVLFLGVGFAALAIHLPLQVLCGYILFKVSTAKIEGVTGDILGACNEFGALLFLLTSLMIGRFL